MTRVERGSTGTSAEADASVDPVDVERIQLLVLADADFDGQLRDAVRMVRQCPAVSFDAHAQAAEVGAIADQPQLELLVGIAAVIAEQLQPPVASAQEQIGVAVIVEVREGHLVDAARSRAYPGPSSAVVSRNPAGPRLRQTRRPLPRAQMSSQPSLS